MACRFFMASNVSSNKVHKTRTNRAGRPWLLAGSRAPSNRVIRERQARRRTSRLHRCLLAAAPARLDHETQSVALVLMLAARRKKKCARSGHRAPAAAPRRNQPHLNHKRALQNQQLIATPSNSINERRNNIEIVVASSSTRTDEPRSNASAGVRRAESR